MADETQELEPLFPALPDDLSLCSDEELTEYERTHLESIQKIRDKDEDFLGDPELRPASKILAELKAGIESLRAVQAVMKERAEAEGNFDEALAEMTEGVQALSAEATDPPEDEEESKDEEEKDEAAATAEALAAEEEEEKTPDEPEAEAETPDEEPSKELVASAPKPVRRRGHATTRHEPMVMRPRDEQGARLLAVMEYGGVRGGKPLDRKGMIEMLDDAIVRTEGMTTRSVLASARPSFQSHEYMNRDASHSAEVISRIKQQIREFPQEEVVASGGRCVPFTPRYDLPFIATDDTPVWDSLATTGADRGGITFPTPLGISDAAGGITVVTAAQDEAGGASGTKTCVVVDCDEFQEAETVAIAGCVEHGNFGARSWPERVDNLSDLLRVAHAQSLETYLLTQIKAGSTALADEAKYGAVSTLLQGIVKGAAFMRNRNRMARDAALNSLIPAWVIDLMVVDVNHVAFNRFVAQAQMEAQLRAFNVNPVFYIDSADDGNMLYGAETTDLQEFKTTVEWGLYPPATWLGLDGGRLDLGIVRDSVLNATNDFQLFFETWNGIAKIGIESLWITSTVCPSGATAPAGTLITC
jgi:lipoate-protein ligase A